MEDTERRGKSWQKIEKVEEMETSSIGPYIVETVLENQVVLLHFI
jgi:hypothetical protein